MHIWLLSGYAGSGKDTIAAMMLEILGPLASKASFASAVKDEVAAMYELTRESLDTQAGKARILRFVDGTQKMVRDLLIEHGETTKTIYGPYVWANRLQNPNTVHWILSDWRFHAERDALLQRFPDAHVHTVRIQRPSVEPLNTYTEHELNSFPYDYTIENSDSLLYAKIQVNNIMNVYI